MAGAAFYRFEDRVILAHATQCFACGALLERDDEIRRRLALLRDHEPPIDVLEEVMQRIDAEASTKGPNIDPD